MFLSKNTRTAQAVENVTKKMDGKDD